MSAETCPSFPRKWSRCRQAIMTGWWSPQPATSGCTPPWPLTQTQTGSRVVPWVGIPRKKVNGTVVGTVGWQRSGPRLAEHLLEIVVVLGDPSRSDATRSVAGRAPAELAHFRQVRRQAGPNPWIIPVSQWIWGSWCWSQGNPRIRGRLGWPRVW